MKNAYICRSEETGDNSIPSATRKRPPGPSKNRPLNLLNNTLDLNHEDEHLVSLFKNHKRMVLSRINNCCEFLS